MATVQEVAKWIEALIEGKLFTIQAIADEVEAQFGPEFIVTDETGQKELVPQLWNELNRIGVRFRIAGPTPKPKPPPDDDETDA